MIYEWKRPVYEDSTGQFLGYVYGESNGMNKPPSNEKGWRRVYSVGIGKVEGAGEAPSRQVSSR